MPDSAIFRPFMSKLSITQWAREDQPREKLLTKGRSTLSNAELIAILINTGSQEQSAVEIAQKILSATNNDLNELAKLSTDELMRFNGIGKAKAISIVSALELGRRRNGNNPAQPFKIKTPADVNKLLKPVFQDLKHEEFWLVLLRRDNSVISKQPISSGGVSGTVADPRIIYKHAVDKLASSIVVAHNHPSGNLKPSEADIRLTKKLREAGKLLDITLTDHLIFTDDGFFSFAEEGII